MPRAPILGNGEHYRPTQGFVRLDCGLRVGGAGRRRTMTDRVKELKGCKVKDTEGGREKDSHGERERSVSSTGC